jgi:ABC-type cobalamin transport system ATPase subunit
MGASALRYALVGQQGGRFRVIRGVCSSVGLQEKSGRSVGGLGGGEGDRIRVNHNTINICFNSFTDSH